MTPDSIDPALVISLAGVVTALVQISKGLHLPDAAAPAVSLGLGIVTAGIWVEAPWREVGLTGVLVGLTASGAYSGVVASRSAITTANVRRRRDRPLRAPAPPG